MRILPNLAPKLIPDWRVVGGDPKVKLSPASRPVKVGTPLLATPEGWRRASSTEDYQLISGGIGVAGDIVRAFTSVVVDITEPVYPPGTRLFIKDVDDYGNVTFAVDEIKEDYPEDPAVGSFYGSHFALGDGLVLLSVW